MLSIHRITDMAELLGRVNDSIVAFVNGVAHYTSMSENGLVIHNANLLTDSEEEIRNLVIMDFDVLGPVMKYKLSDCKKVYITGTSTVNNDIPSTKYIKSATMFKSYLKDHITIVFTLPDNAKNGIPVLCLGGRLFFPGLDRLELYKNQSNYGVFFTISRDVLEGIISINLAKQNPSGSGVKVRQVNLIDFLNNLFVEKITDNPNPNKDCTVPHVIMLNPDNPIYLQITDSISTIEPGMLRFPRGASGILVSRMSRDLFDYTKIAYETESLITVAEPYRRYLDIKVAPSNYSNRHLGFGWHNYNESDKYNPFSVTNRTMIGLETLSLLDIAHDVDRDSRKLLDETGLGFGRITMFPDGPLKRITRIPKNLIPYYQPINIRVSKSLLGPNVIIERLNDNVTGVYVYITGEDEGRMWLRSMNPPFKLVYNVIHQAWTICDADNNIKYQSSLSASFDSETSVKPPKHYNPWDDNLFWFEPINR